MTVVINRDAVGGILLALIGAGIAIFSYANYPIGTISRMGAGMFPAMLGIGLTVVSIAMIIKSLSSGREEIHINVRAGSTILASLVLFAVIVPLFGILPALLALIILSSWAVPDRRIVPTLIFAVVVTIAIAFLFVYVMNLHLPLVRWPL
jgi:hypothetical protein